MRDLYTRIVLWLFGPALELHAERTKKQRRLETLADVHDGITRGQLICMGLEARYELKPRQRLVTPGSSDLLRPSSADPAAACRCSPESSCQRTG